MKVVILLALVAAASAIPVTEDSSAARERRQYLLPGFLNYPGYYPGFVGGYGLGVGVVGRKRREAVDDAVVSDDESDDKTAEKRQLLLNNGLYGAGLYGPGLYGAGVYGAGLYGAPLLAGGLGFVGRKRRDVEDVAATESAAEESKEKRSILLPGYGGLYGAGIYGAGLYGAGLYGGLGYPAAFPAAYPGVLLRKRREAAAAAAHEEAVAEEAAEHQKRQLFGAPVLGAGYLGGYGLGLGLGAVNTGFGYPGVVAAPAFGGLGFVGRKRRDVEETVAADEAAEHHKRQALIGAAPFLGAGYLGGYGLGLGAVNTGFGFPGVVAPAYGGLGFVGRKRRDVEDVEVPSHSADKRNILLAGAGYPVLGAGYLGGYGLGAGYLGAPVLGAGYLGAAPVLGGAGILL